MAIAVKTKLNFFLEVDDYVQADLVNNILSSFKLVESTSLFVPTAEIVFTDDTGILIDNYDRLFTGTLAYNLGFPDEFGTDNTNKYEHLFFSQKPSQLFTGMTTNSVTFSFATWDKNGPAFMMQDHVRSFDGEKSASEVVQEVISDMGLEEGVIEKSQDKQHYIQAQWTNAQFIRYLAERAESKDGVRGFLYFLDREGKFTFASPKYIYEQNKGDAVKLTFTNNPAYYEDNKTETVISWRFVSKAQMWLTSMSYGKIFKYYDREEYKYDEETLKLVDAVSKFNTTEYALLNKDFEDYTKSVTDNTKNVEEFMLNTRPMASSMDLMIMIKYNEDVKLGGVVTFYMPIQKLPEREQEITMDMIGGDWIVCQITHLVDKESMTYYMNLVVTRSGVAQKEAKNLIQ